jgi:hypothetical protein
MTAAYVSRTDSISTTCFKRRVRREEFVLTAYRLRWDTVQALVDEGAQSIPDVRILSMTNEGVSD